MTNSQQVLKDLSGKNHTWVVIENGQAPRKIQRRIDFPVGIFSGVMREFENLRMVSVALPD